MLPAEDTLSSQKKPLGQMQQLPLIARGLFLYQSDNTPYAKKIRDNISSDEDNAIFLNSKFADYLIPYDSDENITPLQLPQQSGTSHFSTYTVNPNINYVQSLLDGTKYYDITSSPADIPDLTTITMPNGLNISDEIQTQIGIMQALAKLRINGGPFVQGDVTLTTDPDRIEANVPVYTVANALTVATKTTQVAYNDYVVPLSTKSVPVMLPATDVKYLLSLVTSRFYTAQYIPYDKSHAGMEDWQYYIYLDPTTNKPVFKTGTTNEANVYIGAAPLYSMFMDGDINPNKITAQTATYGEYIPVPNQWALNAFKADFDGSGTKVTVQDLLTTADPALLTSIGDVYTAWKTAYKKDLGTDRTEENHIGPFAFANAGTTNAITIRATSVDDIANGNYVYTSGAYPREFLVIATVPSGATGLGQEFDSAVTTGQYALSLTTGKIYSQADGKPVMTQGSQPVEQVLDPDELLDKLPNIISKNPG